MIKTAAAYVAELHEAEEKCKQLTEQMTLIRQGYLRNEQTARFCTVAQFVAAEPGIEEPELLQKLYAHALAPQFGPEASTEHIASIQHSLHQHYEGWRNYMVRDDSSGQRRYWMMDSYREAFPERCGDLPDVEMPLAPESVRYGTGKKTAATKLPGV